MLRLFHGRNQGEHKWLPKHRTQDGLQLLAADHRKVEEPVRQLREARAATAAKEKIVKQICTELKVHAQIEEEIYYPAIRGKVEEDDARRGLCRA